ncbi:DUF3307 domain-containing protein [Planococcus sp. CPCC 101016]|uniref:DUF3307 domain-containing protein n=1 Tax=Planococcus sp. CPCC 101016 TaxID=2599617 RepID=UPI0011B85E4C|nr:DUF3307 domain-containing protein [Planococcus sp. CPCC 101016]TWT04491.1 DUF3307 domain-containing protein [Planococcus sp. CPCC 101016]
MSQFDVLLIGHLIGDFLLQTSWMAKHKASKWLPLLTHVSVYTIVIAVFGIFSGGLSLPALAIIFIGHIILDRRSFVMFWVERIQTAKGPEKAWLSIMADQIFHIILLAIAIAIS